MREIKGCEGRILYGVLGDKKTTRDWGLEDESEDKEMINKRLLISVGALWGYYFMWWTIMSGHRRLIGKKGLEMVDDGFGLVWFLSGEFMGWFSAAMSPRSY